MLLRELSRWYPVQAAVRPNSQTVMGQLKAWFDDYNSFNPHSALSYLPPQMFRERRPAT
jgi:transposase InsO family protein